MSAADLQRIQVKVFFADPGSFKAEPFIAILDAWRTPDATGWVDFADYAHVKDGPVVLLCGFERNVFVDVAEGRPGIMIRWRRGLEGSDEERIARVVREAVEATVRVLADPRCPPGLRPTVPAIEIALNDRLDFPDDASTDARLGAPVRAVLDRAFGKGGYSADRHRSAARRYGWHAVAGGPRALESIAV